MVEFECLLLSNAPVDPAEIIKSVGFLAATDLFITRELKAKTHILLSQPETY